MSQVRVNVAGREYPVACDDGEEERLKSLARLLDARVRGLSGGGPADAQIMMLSGLMLTDELEDAKRDLARLRAGDDALDRPMFDAQRQADMEASVAATLQEIAARVEAITGELEKI